MALDPTKNPNSSFLKRLGDKDPVVIRLGPKQKAVARVQGPRQSTKDGLRRPLRRKKYRRGLSVLKYFNFWDLGQIWNGSEWVDIDWYVANFNCVAGIFPGSGRNQLLSLDLADWNTLVDVLMEVPVEDWDTNYRKFTWADGERYGLDMILGPDTFPIGRNDSRYLNTLSSTRIINTTWSPKGLIVEEYDPAQLAAFILRSHGAFVPVQFNNATFRVTTTPDYSASDVTDFALKLGANIFMMPLPVSLWRRRDYNFTSSGINAYAEVGPWTPLKREFWLDRTDTNFADPLLSNVQPGNTLVDLDATNDSAIINHIAGLPEARYFRRDSGASPVDPVTLSSGLATGGAPAGSVAVDRIYQNWDDNPTSAFAIGITEVPAGALVLVVKQAGQTYYIWTDFLMQVSSLFLGGGRRMPL
jgi:hypothetical protein